MQGKNQWKKTHAVVNLAQGRQSSLLVAKGVPVGSHTRITFPSAARGGERDWILMVFMQTHLN